MAEGGADFHNNSGFSDSEDEGWESNIPLPMLSGVVVRDRLDEQEDSSSSEDENEPNEEEIPGTIMRWVRQEPRIEKVPPIMNFEEETGINTEHVDKSALKTAADYFYVFFTMEFITELVHATNAYAAESRRTSQHKSDWTPVDVPTMRVFIALAMLMGVLDKPRLKDYWSTTVQIATPFFSSMLKRDRFMTILR